MKERKTNKIPRLEIESVFSHLNDSGITYALKTNNGNELPDDLQDGKDIDLLVSPDDIDLLRTTLGEIGFHRIAAFKGKENGYRFAYGLLENQIYEKKLKQGKLYLDADFALMCLSLQPKVWIPLDKVINQYALKNRVFNPDLNCWELDDETRLIYLLVRSVFDKHQFTDVYINEIEKRKSIFDQDSFNNKMSKVFYKFAPRLISLLKTQEYQDIYHEYITFSDY